LRSAMAPTAGIGSVPGESARRVKLTRWRGRVVPFS
jgi:hypothetical protein